MNVSGTSRSSLKNVDSARARDPGRELRLAPADLQRRDYVIEKIGGDAAGIVPVLAETEESIGVVGPLGRGPQPCFPVDVILTLAVRAGFLVDGPVPLALIGVAVIRALAHDHLADHAVGDGLACLPPLVAGSGLRAHLEDALGLLHGTDQLLDLLIGMAHGILEIDILAMIHGIEGDFGVPMVGRGDDDCIHVRTVQDFPVIQVAVALETVRLRLLALFVDIADGHDLAGIVVLLTEMVELSGHIRASATNADHTDVNAVVRTDYASARPRAARGRECGAGYA